MEPRKAMERWRTWVVILLITVVAVLSYGVALLNQDIEQTKSVGASNNAFLGNFSNYMRCLVVNDDEVIIAVGVERYFNLCDDLLFEGTGQRAKIKKVVIPPDATSTTTTLPPETTTTTIPITTS